MRLRKVHIHKPKDKKSKEEAWSFFLTRHPLLFWLILLIGMPILILICVALLTAVFMTPISFLFGWI
ncbi:hypothetical protein [Anaerotignum sp. MB30-C6]|uniref:hypothetical protein n=1 Tax=Anaerotignum sp. MB30-C6 TaxID=3070814 RepID=UPI0027DD0B5B|nr:hypothetical protein [Anaerotignum sp. MB30-C6]WMI79785.1 hypothetical protein RBQ60_07965 [Anaerotignum sp. MB30-C6]